MEWINAIYQAAAFLIVLTIPAVIIYGLILVRQRKRQLKHLQERMDDLEKRLDRGK
jgi:uncharacterized membrane-anchored protein YhcB (DUF1043 family)